jgi:hypothetical protein
MALLAAAVSALFVCESAHATGYTWKTLPTANTQTFTWSTVTNWTTDTSNSDESLWPAASSYPNLTADTAVIDNYFNNNADTNNKWAFTPTTINLDVTGVSITSLLLRDRQADFAPSTDLNRMVFSVTQDATIQTITTDYDAAARSSWSVSSGKTLQVNTITNTGAYINGVSGGGTVQFIPNGSGIATWNYLANSVELFTGANWDFSTVTTMNMSKVSGNLLFEGRGNKWTVGNASGAQTWTFTGGELQLINRDVGAWNFIKPAANDIDMGARTTGTLSSGVLIAQSTSGDFNGLQQRNLFATSTGGQSGGTVKVADYAWTQNSDSVTTASLHFDRLGANLTITSGGKYQMLGRINDYKANDVNMFWVLPTNTVQVLGTGGIIINDAYAAGTDTGAVGGNSLPGRMGIYFAGATLDTRADLSLTGPSAAANSGNVFLNDGTSRGDANASSSVIKVGGNLTVQARNAAGFSSLTNLVTNTSAASDDFDLRSTLLQMDGGAGTHNVTWQNGATARNGVGLVSGDFSQANFMLGTFKVTNSTTASYVNGSVLYLNTDFILDAGSTLTLNTTGEINLLDLDNSETARLTSYISGGQLLNAHIVQTDGVGESILPGPPVPEPASLSLLALGGLLTLRRRTRRVSFPVESQV